MKGLAIDAISRYQEQRTASGHEHTLVRSLPCEEVVLILISCRVPSVSKTLEVTKHELACCNIALRIGVMRISQRLAKPGIVAKFVHHLQN